MGSLLKTEKSRYTSWKKDTKYLSLNAKKDGLFRGTKRAFCIPKELSEENIYEEVRDEAISFFGEYQINWHQGINKKPSNHLCDSQVCCVNFLFPWSDNPDALAMLFKRYYPDLKRMLPIEGGRYVTFEYIGQENYLKENGAANGKRTRGANYTSADAAIMFEKENELRQIVLIEWKYTESYTRTSLKQAKSGTSRKEIYEWLYDAPDTIINKNVITEFGDLFYEPFYQLMRQQFLANEMEKAEELGADIVSILHISPECNKELRTITSPNLVENGKDVFIKWSDIINNKDRFRSIHTEDLFGGMDYQKTPDLIDWWNYIIDRYNVIV